MKKLIKSFLKKWDLYEYVRYSKLFNLYILLFKNHEYEKQLKEINFYTSFLKKCSLIFDIGANDGHKTEAFLKISDRVVCVEPDKKNYRILQLRFRSYKQRVSIENKAVSESFGFREFFIHHPGSAFNTLNHKFKEMSERKGLTNFREDISYSEKRNIQTTTLDDLIKIHGKPDFIKIDTEGQELYILKGLSQDIAFITAEFLFPEFRPEFEKTITLLEGRFPNALLYNIAIDEKLVYPSFQDLKLIRTFLEEKNNIVFELILFNKNYLQ
jgi:FkbM family methyltransferase